MMMKVFDEVMEIVERVMQVQRADVMASRKEAAADARCLFVWVLSDDFTDGEIARYLGLTRQAVNGIKNGARQRIRGRRVLQAAEQEIRKEIARKQANEQGGKSVICSVGGAQPIPTAKGGRGQEK